MAFGDNFPPGFDPNNIPVEVRGGGWTVGKFLTDQNGNYIINPLNGMAFVVPKDFSLEKAIEFGRSLGGHYLDTSNVFSELYRAVKPNGPWDLQRSYNGGSGEFVSAFTDGASFVYGVIGRAAGLPETVILMGGGKYNIRSW